MPPALAAEPVLPMTRWAPSRRAIGPAIEPTEPAPPETKTVSPGRTGATWFSAA